MVSELELFDDVAGALRQPFDVRREVSGDIVRVAFQLREIELARVVEIRSACVEEHPLDGALGVLGRLQLRVLGQDLRLGLFEHAIEAP